ncbi:MAG: hypothetical protein R3C25_08480 [Hyphomonadaceae bacterium]
MVAHYSEEEKIRITEFVAKNNLAGSLPAIDEYNLDSVKQIDLPWVGERADRLLLAIEKWTKSIGERVKLTGGRSLALLAITASKAEDEVAYLLGMLRQDGFVDFPGLPHADIQITPEGYRYLQSMRSRQADSRLAFVAMWFGEDMERAYSDGIAPAIADAGYVPLRIDRKEHNNKIDDEIIAEIRRSRFLVADFTSEPEKPRGGVYFEAGFAKGLGREVIWTCRRDCLEYVHFDTRQYAHLVWETPEQLRPALATRISAVLGDGPLKGMSN